MYRMVLTLADLADMNGRRFPLWPYPPCTLFDALLSLRMHSLIAEKDERICKENRSFYYKAI